MRRGNLARRRFKTSLEHGIIVPISESLFFIKDFHFTAPQFPSRTQQDIHALFGAQIAPHVARGNVAAAARRPLRQQQRP